MNNLTVKTKEAQFTVACEDAECNDLFRRIVKKLSAKLLGTEAEKSEINHCKCGNQIRAMTNESSSVITITCHTCGAPLDLEYNKKENRYENMR